LERFSENKRYSLFSVGGEEKSFIRLTPGKPGQNTLESFFVDKSEKNCLTFYPVLGKYYKTFKILCDACTY
jgi:hypothetical protein